MTEFQLDAAYGKQSVPVFKIIKKGPKHEVIDLMVDIQLVGDVKASWLTGDNHQILPTETQKNTCYALALKTEYNSAEDYGLSLGRDILARHAHFTAVNLTILERPWRRYVTDSGEPHDHVFLKPIDPEKKTCTITVPRVGGPTVTSGIKDLCLMKTTQSGFLGYIKDQYTNLQPVGPGSDNPDRIMCTELEASWRFGTLPEKRFVEVNKRVTDILFAVWSGPAHGGVYSPSVQLTAYNMATEVLRKVPEVSEVTLITPNIHHYRSELEQFGMRNPNVVFQSTECHTTASGRIVTRLSRNKSRL